VTHPGAAPQPLRGGAKSAVYICLVLMAYCIDMRQKQVLALPSAFCCSCGHRVFLISSAVIGSTVSSRIGNESVPIQLAQCRFPGLATSNAKI